LLATARGILGSEDLARDAVQEALVCCWQRPCLPDDPRAWLLRTVVHRALHHSRTQRRAVRRERALAAERREASYAQDPAWHVGRGELGELIETALAELPEVLRQAFIQFELEGQDYAQISAREGIPIGTVRSRLSRARTALRARLGPILAKDPWCLDCARGRRRAKRTPNGAF
jgi:RNA polymerase sigma-70 factor (ECF subfamily)